MPQVAHCVGRRASRTYHNTGADARRPQLALSLVWRALQHSVCEADGRVSGCTITGSSGYSALDAATCALVIKRAKFQPARGGEGEPVAGSYSNAIDWQLPD